MKSIIQGLIITTVLTSCVIARNIKIENRSTHPDVGLRVPELVTKYGYPVESHPVITEDGYILTMHRIPHGINGGGGEKSRPVIFLQHGLLCSSADWVIMGPAKGLAYLLADMGYDVWLGNARGNFYSRKHVTYNPDLDKKEFWNFSWHEIGKIDLPTMIDHILNETEAEGIYYVGHSQGTTSFFVMTSERPEYNEKIKLMIAYAPVAFQEYLPNFALRIIAKFNGVLGWVMEMLGQYEFLPSTKFLQLIGQAMCNEESGFKEICNNILFLIAGYDKPQLNQTMLPVIISNTPAGSSTKQILHYAQLYTSKEFQQFDYGSDNQKIYGPEFKTPPRYNISRITAPVALFYGMNDKLSAEEDVMRLYSALPRAVRIFKVKFDLFSHLDFLWAIDIIKLVYDDTFDLLSRYT